MPCLLVTVLRLIWTLITWILGGEVLRYPLIWGIILLNESEHELHLMISRPGDRNSLSGKGIVGPSLGTTTGGSSSSPAEKYAKAGCYLSSTARRVLVWTVGKMQEDDRQLKRWAKVCLVYTEALANCILRFKLFILFFIRERRAGGENCTSAFFIIIIWRRSIAKRVIREAFLQVKPVKPALLHCHVFETQKEAFMRQAHLCLRKWGKLPERLGT